MHNTDRIFFIGVDLGQRQSNTAFVIVERLDEAPQFTGVLRGEGFTRRYLVRQAERIPLGTPYQVIVNRLKAIVARLNPQGVCVLVVDSTGIGIPIVELMREESVGCRIIPIMITSAEATAPSQTSVPRPALLTKMQVMAQRGELQIAAQCKDAEALRNELAHLTIDGKSSTGDDMAFALALACWRAKIR